MRPIVVALMLIASAAPASAQAPQPVPVIVVDLHGLTVGFGLDPVTAPGLGITVSELPTRGLGGRAAVNLYAIRRRGFSIGAVGEAVIARDTRTNRDSAGMVMSTVKRRFESLSGAVSLNFGHRDGFSYVSVGIGPSLFETSVADRPSERPRQTILNFGGGARWFNTPRLAFSFDVRFYETKPVNPLPTSPGRERRRLLVLAAGISIR